MRWNICVQLRLFVLALLLFTGTVRAEVDATSSIIKGFSAYQADRVENIILDQFARDLAEGEIFRRFFTLTAKSTTGYAGFSGKRLLPIISSSFSRDLQKIKALGSCFAAVDQAYAAKPGQLISELVLIATFTVGKSASVTTVDEVIAGLPLLCSGLDSSGQTVVANAFVNPSALKLRQAVQPLREVKAAGDIPVSVNKVRSRLEIERNISSSSGKNNFKQQLESALKSAGLRLQSVELVIEAVSALAELSEYDSAEKADVAEQKMTLYVHHLFQLVAALGADAQVYDYFNFQNSALFLATLVDSANRGPEAVQAAIRGYVDDEKAFGAKRLESTNAYRSDKPNLVCNYVFFCRNTLFVASYFGGNYVLHSEDRSAPFRAYGPVGVEIKLVTLNRAPLSIGYAPIDIGAYITNELTGNDYSPKGADIVTNSVYLSYSMADRPIAFLLGYQWNAKIDEMLETDVAFVGVAFDLPLFTLF